MSSHCCVIENSQNSSFELSADNNPFHVPSMFPKKSCFNHLASSLHDIILTCIYDIIDLQAYTSWTFLSGDIPVVLGSQQDGDVHE